MASSIPSPADFRSGSAGRGRIMAIDGLRGVSILLVLMSHGRFSLGFPDLRWLPFDGSQGVTLFFLLTGLLITTLLLDEQEKYGHVSLKSFYARRMLRLFPAYYAYLAFVVVLELMDIADVTLMGFISSATHWRNIYTGASGWTLHHTWSLSMQEQFYLWWPIVVTRLSRRHATYVGLGVIAFWPLIRFLRHGYLFPPDATAALDAPGMETILYGTLLALAMRGGRPLEWLQQVARGWWGIVIPPLVIGTIYKYVDIWPHPWTFVLAPLRNLAAVWLIWWCISNHKTIVGQVLEWKWLRFLGAISYSLYLWQQPFLGLNKGWITFFPQNMVALFACALVSYYVIEMPFNNLRDRFRLTAKPQPKVVERPKSETPPAPGAACAVAAGGSD